MSKLTQAEPELSIDTLIKRKLENMTDAELARIKELPEEEEMVPLSEYQAVVARMNNEIEERDKRIAELEAAVVKPFQ